MLYIGQYDKVQKQYLYGWIDTKEDLQRVAEALDAKVEHIEAIPPHKEFPERTYVPFNSQPLFTARGTGHVDGGCFTIGSWVHIQFDVDTDPFAPVWREAQRVLLRASDEDPGTANS